METQDNDNKALWDELAEQRGLAQTHLLELQVCAMRPQRVHFLLLSSSFVCCCCCLFVCLFWFVLLFLVCLVVVLLSASVLCACVALASTSSSLPSCNIQRSHPTPHTHIKSTLQPRTTPSSSLVSESVAGSSQVGGGSTRTGNSSYGSCTCTSKGGLK